MKIIVLLGFLVVFPYSGLMAEGSDRILHLYGRDFSFKVAEPAGWTLDTRSAPQLANFIFYPAGKNWRKADVLIFARFVPKQEPVTLEEFIRENEEQFEEECPFADPAEQGRTLKVRGGFQTRTFICPGFRSEMVAIGEVGKFFILFSLSSSDPDSLAKGIPALERIVRSFEWFENPPRAPGKH